MRKFNRKTGPRRIFMKSMTANLIMKERIETTEARAKELRPAVERMITIAKKQGVANLRRLLAKLPKNAAQKVFYEIGPRYVDRRGGYTRITKLDTLRKRDGVKKAIIEFV
ncbi:MAG: 50S ribosomal protein L17 [Candidatus Harrisonbacteria bacterium CG10_big_fil_rev_8_21_14_0_10_42_17]|uniref:50S ribosomal protein L17 n=1 Tax=Candidatus Harrisonbacteria bacterium CG10_big_fil_rev_8_21_14_0_10_42_17 TaxID=1974584 RepID=A0A2M6WHZ6_9BACT|nr:MAG: 50S ribosomal protein L17 [Candidatus Harrisonbacteria bacterium CG10_big_fil_rev_8_21_14_0_10_42_17]